MPYSFERGIIRRDELDNAEEEMRELIRLYNEARWRYRNILKRRKIQTWWDWLWETIGY